MTQDPGKEYAGTLPDLKQKGFLSIAANGHDIAVFFHNGQVYALDNRCPHMGFPLSKGSTKDGILTCDWHHAKFDLKSGGCFDLWAGDVQVFPVHIDNDGKVWVVVKQDADRRSQFMDQLQEGLTQNNSLLIAKSVIGSLSEGVEASELFRRGIEHGVRYRQDGWGTGLTILTCMMNLLPYLCAEDRPRALFHGLSAVAQDCSGVAPRFPVAPLPKAAPDIHTLNRWFRQFVEMRDSDGAERCLATAIRMGSQPLQVADMLFAAATDHRYLDTGHVLDFTNKAFEALDIVGWEMSEPVLTSLVPMFAEATRMEERSSWRHPVDIAKILHDCFADLPVALEKGSGKRGNWKRPDRFGEILLGDNPAEIANTLLSALASGATEEILAQAVTSASAVRIAQFPTTNEFSDWDTALHTFTSANAVTQSLRRLQSAELLRAVFDVAMSNYINRFLNVPAVVIPAGLKQPSAGDTMPASFLELLDKRQQIDEAAKMVAIHLANGGDRKSLLAMLGKGLLREDRSFHTIQMLEGVTRQQSLYKEEPQKAAILIIAAARYLAAHSATNRSQGQTFDIASRLQRAGGSYENIE